MSNNGLIISIVMGFITFILATSSNLPQLLSLIRTRNSSGVSLTSYIICAVDNVIWLAWTFGYYFNMMYKYTGDNLRLLQASLLTLLFCYLFGSILATSLLVFKAKYVLEAKKLNVTELELAKILLDRDKKKYFDGKKWHNGARYLPAILFIIGDLLFTLLVVFILGKFGYVTPKAGTKDWLWVIILGFACSIIWEITCWPQFIKSVKEKDMTGVSLFWSVFGTSSVVVNFVYDFVLSFNAGAFSYDMIFVLIFSGMAPTIGVLILKIININKAKKAGMSELEYTKKIIIPSLKNKKKNQKAK